MLMPIAANTMAKLSSDSSMVDFFCTKDDPCYHAAEDTLKECEVNEHGKPKPNAKMHTHPLDMIGLRDYKGRLHHIEEAGIKNAFHGWCGLSDMLLDSGQDGMWEYRAFWCGINHLFYNPATDSIEDDESIKWAERPLIMLDAMENMSGDGLNTAIAQAMVRYHWQLFYPWFLFDNVVDVISLVVLRYVAGDLHDEWVPRLWVPLSLLVLIAWPIAKVVSTIRGAFKVYKGHWGSAVITNYNIVYTLFDVFGVLIVTYYITSFFHWGGATVRDHEHYTLFGAQLPVCIPPKGKNSCNWTEVDTFLNDTTKGAHKCLPATGSWVVPFYRGHVLNSGAEVLLYQCSFVGRHPTLLFLVIATRWVHFMLSLLNFEVIGRTILPVWEAARGQDSVVFMAYLLVATMGIAHAYFSFPLTSDDSDILPQ